MTLCVAGFCDNGETLVVAHDLMVTFGSSQAPVLPKQWRFMHTWIGLFAGNESPVEPVLNRVLRRLESASNSLHDITDAFAKSYQEERLLQMNDRLLAKWGMNYDFFLKSGKKLLQEHQYQKIWSEIADFELGTQFLVGGFDENGQPHLFGVFDPGHVEHYMGHGYFAIGTDQEEAMRMLGFRGYNWGTVNSTQGIYLVTEAKVFGEGPYVGRETIVTVISPKNSRGLSFYLSTHSDLRQCIKQGKRRDAEASIDKLPWGPFPPRIDG